MHSKDNQNGSESGDEQSVQEETKDYSSTQHEHVPISEGPGTEQLARESGQPRDLANCTRLVIDGQVIYVEGNRTILMNTNGAGLTVNIVNHNERLDRDAMVTCSHCNGLGSEAVVYEADPSAFGAVPVCRCCRGSGIISRNERPRPAPRPRRPRRPKRGVSSNEPFAGAHQAHLDEGSHMRQPLGDLPQASDAGRSNTRAAHRNEQQQAGPARGQAQRPGTRASGAAIPTCNTATQSGIDDHETLTSRVEDLEAAFGPALRGDYADILGPTRLFRTTHSMREVAAFSSPKILALRSLHHTERFREELRNFYGNEVAGVFAQASLMPHRRRSAGHSSVTSKQN